MPLPEPEQPVDPEALPEAEPEALPEAEPLAVLQSRTPAPSSSLPPHAAAAVTSTSASAAVAMHRFRTTYPSRSPATPPNARHAYHLGQGRPKCRGWHAGGMDQYVSIVTLGCPDVAAARRFYVDGLGWTPLMEVPDEVVFVQVGGGVALALWRADALGEDRGRPASGDPATAPFALAHNVGTGDEVAEVLEAAEAAGGTVLKPAAPDFFCGV